MVDLLSAKRAVKDWLLSIIRIDVVDLDYPKQLFSPASSRDNPLPANSLIEYPIKNLDYQLSEFSTVVGIADFTFRVVYRFDKSLTAEQLPTDQVEQVAQFIFVSSLLGIGNCESINDIKPVDADYPVQISRTEGDQGDWLVHLVITLQTEFAVTEYLLPNGYGSGADPDFGIDFKKLNLRIYRALIDDLEENTLDADLTITTSS